MSPLEQIESAWLQAAPSIIAAQVKACPQEEFYAAAFWLCYVDYAIFASPCFAMNTEAYYASSIAESGEGVRWSPPNWRFDVLQPAVEAMKPHYQTLTASLTGQPDEEWEAAMEEHWQMLARVCRQLTRTARGREGAFAGVTLPPHFVVGIFEEREGEPIFSRLVRASISPEILRALPSPIWEKKEE